MTDPSQGEETPVRPLALALVGISALGVAFCITLLFLGMRGILDLGGFVASGGAYEISQPAPDWVWVLPVAVVCGFAFGGLNVAAAWRARGFNLLPFIWTGLFLALGWNFLEYGFRPPGGDGLAWGWIVCGVVFWLMAVPAIPAFYGGKYLWGRYAIVAGGMSSDAAAARPQHRHPRRVGYLVLNLAAIAAGVVVGIFAFRAIAG